MDCSKLQVRVVALEVRLEERQRAIELQAAEYMRRLDDLNHAHRQAVLDRQDFISFAGKTNEVRHEALLARIDSMERWQAKLSNIESDVVGIGQRTMSMERWQAKIIGFSIAGAGAVSFIVSVLGPIIDRFISKTFVP